MLLPDTNPEYVNVTAPIGLEIEVEGRTEDLTITLFCWRSVTEALNAIAGIESRVSRVEDGLFNNITGNPFLASFDSLDGITLVKGIWNEERKRIEC